MISQTCLFVKYFEHILKIKNRQIATCSAIARNAPAPTHFCAKKQKSRPDLNL